ERVAKGRSPKPGEGLHAANTLTRLAALGTLSRSAGEGRCTLPRRELRLAEHDFALGLGDLASVPAFGQHRDTTLHRRPGRDLVVPPLYRRIIVEIDGAAPG